MSRFHTIAALFIAGASVLGCRADHASGPTMLSPESPTLSTAPDLKALKRGLGYANGTLTVAKTIGPEGGTLTLPERGLTLVVPAGAVTAPTNFSVMPVGGDGFAYHFEPHGTTFLVPLVATQELGSAVMPVDGTGPYAAYFGSSTEYDPATGVVASNDLRRTIVDTVKKTVTFRIPHFSGWVVATGIRGSTVPVPTDLEF